MTEEPLSPGLALAARQGDPEAEFGQIVSGRQPQTTKDETDAALDYGLKLKGPQPPTPEKEAGPQRYVTPEGNAPTGIRSQPTDQTTEPVPAPEAGRPPDLPIFDRVMKARKAGYSWQDINNELNAGAMRAAAGGYNQQEIDAELGYKQETGFKGFKEAMDLAAKQVAGLEPGKGPDPKGFLEWLSTGEKMSSYGLYSAIAAGQKGSDVFTAANAPPSWGEDPTGRFAFDLGVGIGDIPAMAMGAKMGGPNPVAAAAGAMGYPAYLKSVYTAQLMEGSVKDGVQFAKRVWDGVVEAAPQAAVGAAMGIAGKAAGEALEGTQSPMLAEGAKLTQEIGTMAIAQAVIDGKWPTIEELIDNVVTLKALGLATGSDTLIGSQLAKAWAKGWGSVTDAATRAMTDPVFRSKILNTNPDAPAESSAVPTPHEGVFEVPRTHGPDTGAHPGDNFDDAVKVEIKLEGGYTRDTGGRTNHGISENAHPEAWANGPPTEAQAVAIYKHDYWDKIDADNLPAAIRLTAMDAAVNEGPGKAREMLRASGGDVDKFNELRKAHYDALVRANPDKYQKYYRGWMNRLNYISSGKIPEGSVPHVPDSSFSVENEPVYTPFKEFNEKELQDRNSDFESEQARLRESGSLPPKYADLDKALNGVTHYTDENAPDAIKAAKEMGRTDISQAILDRAASERDATRAKLKAMGPEAEVANPAAYAALMQLYADRTKNTEALAKLSGQVPSAAKMRSLEVKQQPALNSQEHPLVKAAQTGDAAVDSAVNDAASVIANARVNKNYDTPWTASASKDINDPTVYIGKHVPDELTTASGKKFSTTEPLIIHENVEQHVMEKLIAAGWSKQEAYEVAHYAFADAAENAYYRSIGIDPKEAAAAWKPVIDQELTEKGPTPPHAYRDTGQFNPGSHAAHDDQTDVPSPEKIAQAKAIIAEDLLALKRNQNTTGRGRVKAENPLRSNPETFEDAMKTVRQHVVRGDHQATLTEKMAAYAYKGYIELFEDRAPIRLITEMINRGRLDKGRSPLADAANPTFLRRLADNAPNVLAKVAIDHGMIKFHRDEETGKLTGRIIMTGTQGLADIMGNKSFKSEQERNEFEAYMVSRWALEKAKQGKTTGVPKDAAQMVVDHIEDTGKFIPTETLMNVANRLGVRVFHHDINDPNDKYIQKMQLNGPHYNPATGEIHLFNEDYPYEKTWGEGVTHDMVLAHEIGHAVAKRLGVVEGVPAVRLSELADQLSIASHRFRAGMWEKFRSAADHRYFSSDEELIADAMATWIQDPVARNRLSALKDIVPDVEKFGKAPGDDWGNEHMRRFDALVDYQNRSFQLMRDAGVIGNDLFIKAVSDNAARIPGYRAQEDMDEQARADGDLVPERGYGHTGTARPAHIAFNPIRSFNGSEFRLDNIMKGLTREIFTRTKVALENYANQGLVAAASEIEGVVKQMPTATVVPTSLADLGKLSQPGPAGKDVDNSIKWMLTGHNITEDEIPVYFEGKRTIWKFADKEVPRLLKGLNEHELNIVQKVMRPIVRVMRQGIISNPAFAVRLFAYDVPWQFITKPGFRNTLADVLVGMKAAWGKSGDDYERFLLSSAAERVFDGSSQAEYLKEKFKTGGDFAENLNVPNAATDPRKAFDLFMRAATLPWRVGAKITGFVSEAQRIGRFKRGLEEGESDIRAGAMGSDAPFHRAGNSGPTTRMLNSMQPFVQAHLNSMEKIIRGQFGIGADVGGEAYDAVNFTLKALAAITLPAMTNWALSHNEDWYKEAPDWQKDNGLLFRIGEHTLYIPFPPLLGAIYGGMFKRAASAFIDHDPHAFDNMGTSLGMALLPPGIGFSSNIAVPLIESVANHSFFKDAPLEGQAQLGHTPHMRATPFTSGFAKGIARGIYSITGGAFDFSPIIIDHLIQGYGGTMATILTRNSEMALRSAGIMTPPPIPYQVEDWAGISSFFERYPSAYSTSTRHMMDRMAEQKQIHSDLIKALTTGDFEGFKEIIDNHPLEAAARDLKLTKKEEEIAASLGHDQAKFFDYWHEADDKMSDQDRDAAQQILSATKAIDVLRQEIANNEALARAGKLKGSDALQIRDQHYLAISGIARDTIKLMDQSQWK